jgi:CheY-like chemotaxis protein
VIWGLALSGVIADKRFLPCFPHSGTHIAATGPPSGADVQRTSGRSMAVVLLVDDEPTIIAILAELVEEYGHTALTAYNGVAALDVAGANPPTLIISDVMMPVMDGYELLKAIRDEPALAHTAVYLMSAAAFRPLPSGDAPPDGYMAKPLDFTAIEGLLAAIA